MAEVAAVSRSEFEAAATGSSDLRVISSYFAQAHVAAEVVRVNSYFHGRRPSINIFDDSPEDPWYFVAPSHDPWLVAGGIPGQREFLFTPLLTKGHTEVVEWFYASAQVALLGSTLAALLPFTAALAADENQKGLIESLLTSEVFETLYDDLQQQQLLSDMLGVAVERNHIDVIDLLMAHGANVNPPSDQRRDKPLASCAAMGTEESVATLVEHGAFVVGSSLLIHASLLGNLESACELLRSGVDWGNHAGHANPLHAAAVDGHADLVRIYLEEGFADVDARNARGETALMLATALDSTSRGAVGPHAAEDVAHELIDHGADVFLKDTEGRTALHHAIGSEYSAVVALLLSSGLDPNDRNAQGKRPLDSLPLMRLDDEDVAHVQLQVELLVAYGTDLLARGRADEPSAFDRLQETMTGQALLARVALTGSHPAAECVEIGMDDVDCRPLD